MLAGGSRREEETITGHFRPISGSKDIEVWFGGNMLTVEELITMVADQFGVSLAENIRGFDR